MLQNRACFTPRPPKPGCETITTPQIFIWSFDNYGNYGNKKNRPRYNINFLVTQLNVKSAMFKWHVYIELERNKGQLEVLFGRAVVCRKNLM